MFSIVLGFAMPRASSALSVSLFRLRCLCFVCVREIACWPVLPSALVHVCASARAPLRIAHMAQASFSRGHRRAPALPRRVSGEGCQRAQHEQAGAGRDVSRGGPGRRAVPHHSDFRWRPRRAHRPEHRLLPGSVLSRGCRSPVFRGHVWWTSSGEVLTESRRSRGARSPKRGVAQTFAGNGLQEIGFGRKRVSPAPP